LKYKSIKKKKREKKKEKDLKEDDKINKSIFKDKLIG
jgi:hypothetical protein